MHENSSNGRKSSSSNSGVQMHAMPVNIGVEEGNDQNDPERPITYVDLVRFLNLDIVSQTDVSHT